jgi:environmental stress-induced protein Ves
MTRLSLLSPSDYQRTRWKNDGGWTTEIARSADDSSAGFRWRISIAEIERDGPFSSFPGIARDLLLLDGNGIELDIDDAPPRRLARRFERVHFEGEARVDCRLLAGPTRDYNVMARRDAVRADVVARPLVGPMVIFPEAGCEWFVHVLAGEANLRAGGRVERLAASASLLADFRDSAGERIVIEGGGEIVLVKLASAAAGINR